MIPQKYQIGNANKESMQGTLIKDGTKPPLYVDVLTWLEDLEERLNKMRESLATAGGIIFKKPVDGITLTKDNKTAEIAIYENNKKFTEVLSAIKDPEKQKLKIYEFTEFIIYNLLAVGADNKPMDPDRQKQIVDNALKKLEEENIKRKDSLPMGAKDESKTNS